MSDQPLANDVGAHFASARLGIDSVAQVHLMENHDRSYFLWRDAGLRNRILVHIDAHHDMWWFDDNRSLTIANFICIALRERIVREVYWVVPDGTWDDPAGRKALGGHLKEILRTYPGGSAPANWENRQVRTSVLGCPLVICSLDTLPAFPEDVLLDIDTDYMTIPRVSYRTEDVITPEPWRSPQELTELLRDRALRTDFVTIAYSVEGGYTPLAWKYLGDELALRVGRPDQRDEADAYLRMRTGIVARLHGDIAAAEADFHAVEDKLGAAPYFHLANLMAEGGRPDDARRFYERALAKDPSYRTAYAGTGFPLFRAKQDAASRDAFNRALELDPSDPYPHLGLGWIAARGKRWAEAEREFRAALTLRPDLIDAHRGLAEAAEKQGRLRDAIEPYQQFLKLTLRGHRPLTEAIATDPSASYRIDSEHLRVHAKLARVYARLGDTKNAIAGYRIAIAGGYDTSSIRWRLAALYLRRGDWRHAVEHGFAAVALIPAAVQRLLYRWFRLGKPAYARKRGPQVSADSHQMAAS